MMSYEAHTICYPRTGYDKVQRGGSVAMRHQVREFRQARLNELEHSSTTFANTVFFKDVGDRRVIDYISVELAIEWPKKSGLPVSFSETEDDILKTGTFNFIMSVQGFLESLLLQNLQLYEIRTGCIEAKFKILGSTRPATVARALRSLIKSRERYRVLSAKARVGERRVDF